MNMEGGVRSGGVVLKKKTSSGCLIIKKKGGFNNSGGLGGLGVSGNERKRPRLVAPGDLGVGDGDEQLEFMRRRVNDRRSHDGSVAYTRNGVEGRGYDGRESVGIERKRSRPSESYEFDEFDGKMRNEYADGRFNVVGRGGGGKLKEFGVGSSGRNLATDKRMPGSYLAGYGSGRGKGSQSEDDEASTPISLLKLKYQGEGNEPIRLQGKNGVLKVMVNKKKRMDLPSQDKMHDPREVEEREGSRSVVVVKKDLSVQLPVYPAPQPPETRGLFAGKAKKVEKREIKMEKERSVVKVEKERSVVKVEKEKSVVKVEKVKSISSKGIKQTKPEADGTDTALKLAPPVQKASSSKKGVKAVKNRSPPPETVTPVKVKDVKERNEGKAKQGGSTEKQLLREKIRGMLIGAGWTIDYRPRRNRDYLDAVYINPSGTAYWSIIKAYDAFKKQLEEDNARSKTDMGSDSFAPLSEDLINKLTRQTKKKIEQEMKRKGKEDSVAKIAKNNDVKEAAASSHSEKNEGRSKSRLKQNKSPRRKSRKVDQESEDYSSDDSFDWKPKTKRFEKPCKKIGRCTLLVRGSEKGEKTDSDGYVPYNGKRTVLAWLIDSGTAQLSEKVQYMNRRRTRVMLEGWITRDGIHCGCCSKILTVSKFELHAGSKLRQPFQNILLESGASLLQCQIEAWKRQGESIFKHFNTVDAVGDDPDDDACGACGDGGALIICDSCPSTFHQSCLEVENLYPDSAWHCPNCACVLCSDVTDLLECNFCEKNYHQECSEWIYELPKSPTPTSFCQPMCQELLEHVQKILGVKHELEGGFSWSLIHRTEVCDTSKRGFPQRMECNSKLAVALAVMNECFLPIIDRRSGINLVHNVVYNCGSNFPRLNFRRFFAAVLERGDEIVAAASLRIHGNRVAEMPFIGTREIYRRQGMCRRLLSAIETVLSSMKVEHLIIPAIAEHMNTWTSAFGFSQLDSNLQYKTRTVNTLAFPGTDLLQKPIAKQENSDGTNFFASIKGEPPLHARGEKYDTDSSSENNEEVAENSVACHDTKNSDKVSARNDGKAAGASATVCESNILLASNGVCEPVIGNNSKLEVAPQTNGHKGSFYEKPEHSTSSKANGEQTEFSPENDLEAPLVLSKPNGTVHVQESELHSSVEPPSPDSDPKLATINGDHNAKRIREENTLTCDADILQEESRMAAKADGTVKVSSPVSSQATKTSEFLRITTDSAD